MRWAAKIAADAVELRRVQVREGREIAPDHRLTQCFRHIAACILQQRHEIIGGRSDNRVLEIEKPAGAHRRAAGKQHQIVNVKVAQYEGRLKVLARIRQQSAPKRQILLAQCGRNRFAEDRRHVPID